MFSNFFVLSLHETLVYSFCLLYILFVRKNFDSSESISVSIFESGYGKHFADDFIIRPI